MAKQPTSHPTLSTPRLRLRLRQFRAEDTDAMHGCFANPEAMRFWNRPVHTKRIETERAVRSFIELGQRAAAPDGRDGPAMARVPGCAVDPKPPAPARHIG
jgi:RimJ/RimL family protein N-acetyltransferase